MILSWRKRRACRRAGKNDLSQANLEMELTIPSHFRCPISLDLMKDPVTLSTGITYDRESIEKWIESGNFTCPVTNQVLRNFDQIPNHAIRRMIQDWCVENRSHGIERIPTPRIPVTPHDVSGICSKIILATQRGDQKKCLELVSKIKTWARESERNKRCITENGAGFVLSSSFESFSSFSIKENEDLLGETLSAMTWMFPLGSEAQSKLSSASSLRCMAWFLMGEDLSSRQNSVLALKELLSSDQRHINDFAEIEGVDEALVQIIKEQTCPTSTKASLMVIYYMISSSKSSEKITSRFVELGLVSIVLEILVGGERSISEKALAVLDNICSWKKGIEKARNHALTMPVLVKKILRVSDMATKFSVSILWKICKNSVEDGGDDNEMVEALQLGAFQKLLVVLQVGCGEKTKEKATELLKLLNQFKDRLDCFDSSMDFKYLRRP
ncbi:U-box domain-containing protein 21 [Camellia lanceoleosa]|uniref:U-box domain-containing protein 21 n=1 Tax=Camellia lanceoleosa TaxID=1840588 RepID=A0ACC0IX80_9ERIC|nr:U-box domain-containing protein 21 [Camellia lanceoleosa]